MARSADVMGSPFVKRLRAAGDWLGSAWIVRLGDEGFVFCAKFVGPTLYVSAIGGKVEAGETFAEAARREYAEETGTPAPRLLPEARPVLLGASLEPTDDTEGACAVIKKRPDTAAPAPPSLWIAVFHGFTEEDPRPVEKIPAFIVVPPSHFDRLASSPLAGRVIGDQRVAAHTEAPALKDTPKAIATRPELLHELWQSSGRAARRSEA